MTPFLQTHEVTEVIAEEGVPAIDHPLRDRCTVKDLKQKEKSRLFDSCRAQVKGE